MRETAGILPLVALLGITLVRAADAPPQSTLPPSLPEGAKEYKSTEWTQSIAVVNGQDRIAWVPVKSLAAKWRVSGGMEGLIGWQSKKYKLIPEGESIKSWVGDIAVLNSYGYYQNNRGIRREYPNGTEFHDVLSNDKGVVFEHRVRRKVKGRWDAEVVYQDKGAFPKGYSGLAVSCISCHKQAGTGGYAVGLVPGGDTVFSDELDWSLVTR